jgi:cysteine synthase (EC 2.5.1.47)
MTTHILDLIGHTPLLPLHPVLDLPASIELYGKAEWYNLGGSVKDRPALWMIRDGERRGLLRPGVRIADATSGNTGIAYATIGAALGYGVTLAMPANASPERRRILRALGAELILTDPADGMDAAIATIRALVADIPTVTSTPISTAIRLILGHTMKPPAQKSGSRLVDGLHTSLPHWERVAPLWAQDNDYASTTRRFA